MNLKKQRKNVQTSFWVHFLWCLEFSTREEMLSSTEIDRIRQKLSTRLYSQLKDQYNQSIRGFVRKLGETTVLHSILDFSDDNLLFSQQVCETKKSEFVSTEISINQIKPQERSLFVPDSTDKSTFASVSDFFHTKYLFRINNNNKYLARRHQKRLSSYPRLPLNRCDTRTMTNCEISLPTITDHRFASAMNSSNKHFQSNSINGNYRQTNQTCNHSLISDQYFLTELFQLLNEFLPVCSTVIVNQRQSYNNDHHFTNQFVDSLHVCRNQLEKFFAHQCKLHCQQQPQRIIENLPFIIDQLNCFLDYLRSDIYLEDSFVCQRLNEFHKRVKNLVQIKSNFVLGIQVEFFGYNSFS